MKFCAGAIHFCAWMQEPIITALNSERFGGGSTSAGRTVVAYVLEDVVDILVAMRSAIERVEPAAVA